MLIEETNLIKFIQNFSRQCWRSSGSLWNFYSEEINDD